MTIFTLSWGAFSLNYHEKDWLDKDLSKDDVMDLCRPSYDMSMRAYTISKLLTTRNMNTNIPQVLHPMNYNPAIKEANQFLESGTKRRLCRYSKDTISSTLTYFQCCQNWSAAGEALIINSFLVIRFTTEKKWQ